ncbi:hypothetical protein V8G54_035445 [Vigna mungo]|uniref:Cytochrome P450 n=1 Tax=Vigna mungo TaxID=3915 RepID=A0AAQ3MFE6_VIGMU
MHHLLLVFVLLLLIVFVVRVAYSVIWVPWIIVRHFRLQGITGPPYRLIKGNTDEIHRMYREVQSKPMALCHDILERVCPFYHRWSRVYGKTVLYWHGSKPKLVLSDPDMLKEILLKTGEWFERIDPNPSVKQFFGQGILVLKGEKWAVHRAIANQAFKIERVKLWVPQITDCTKTMFYKWEDNNKGSDEFEIEVCKDLHDLTSDIISKVAFGSNYEEGKEIFELLEEHYHLVCLAIRSVYIPGFRFLPTKKNRERKRLEKKTYEAIKVLIEENLKAEHDSENLLSLLMSSHKFINNETHKLRLDEIVDDCKNFYMAGKETSATSLRLNQEWQSKAREEVLSVLGPNSFPTSETLSELKLVNLILQETLRLYPNPGALVREASRKVKLGKIDIPAGTQLYLSITSAHHDTEFWGEDALQFNPMRFAEPRKHLAPYFPFGLGPKYCVGQNLAVFEMKIVLAMVLQRFSFVVSPSYAHAPMLLMTMTPQYGMQIIFRKL